MSKNELKANNVKLTGGKSEKGISFEMRTFLSQKFANWSKTRLLLASCGALCYSPQLCLTKFDSTFYTTNFSNLQLAPNDIVNCKIDDSQNLKH